jgi:hypothetical protein
MIATQVENALARAARVSVPGTLETIRGPVAAIREPAAVSGLPAARIRLAVAVAVAIAVRACVACAAAAFLAGCASLGTEPWERDVLARGDMQIVADPLEASLDQHIYFSKEASSGGQGFGGGGCGCN